MKGTKHHQSTSNRFGASLSLKMASRFLLSVSIYSLILSYFNFSFSPYSRQLFGYNIDKNYIFLLCNGILIFIVKNSGAINKSPEDAENDVHGSFAMKKSDSEQKIVKSSEMKECIVEKQVDMEVGDEAQETEKCSSLVAVGAENVELLTQETEKCSSLVAVGAENVELLAQEDDDGEEEDEELEQENEYLITYGVEDEAEGIGLLSTEELNKKCDDFIRKMREVIKFEAQQLIMV